MPITDIPYRPHLTKIIRNRLKDTSLVEDVINQLFIKVVSLDQSKIKNLKAYLTTCAINLCGKINSKEGRYVTKGLLSSDRDFYSLR